jgi:hypothetical protein
MTRLTTATELRNDPNIEYDQTKKGRPFEPNNPEWHTHGRVNTYMVDCLKSYEVTSVNDERLWKRFQEDFEGWNNNLFMLGDRTIRVTLRDYMKDNDINIGGAKYISQQLTDILKEDQYMEWPKEEIVKQLKNGRPFNSYQNPTVWARIEANNATTIEPIKIQTTITLDFTTTTGKWVTPEPTIPSPTPPPLPPA